MKKVNKIFVFRFLLILSIGILSVKFVDNMFAPIPGCRAEIYPETYYKDNVINLRDGDVVGGSIAVQIKGEANIIDSPYFCKFDFYNSSPTKTLIKLDKFQTYQQSEGWSCGAACCLMALNYFGEKNITEKQLISDLDTRSFKNRKEDGSCGTSTKSIVKYFIDHGYKVESALNKPDELVNSSNKSFDNYIDFANYVKKHLRDGNVIMVENVEFGGHWMVIVGYDDMGRPDFPDVHVIVFADPYDVNSHWQDGYIVRSAVRYFDQWFDCKWLPKDQTEQQYVTVYKKSNDK